jgi:hypothetical protein
MTYKTAGLPNIYGTLPNTANSVSIFADGSASGALIRGGTKRQTMALSGSYGYDYYDTLVINAQAYNAIYGNSSTVQPPAMLINYYICYA